MNETADFTVATATSKSKLQNSADTALIEQQKYIQSQYGEFAASKEKVTALSDISNSDIDKSFEFRMFTKALEPLARKDSKNVSVNTEKASTDHIEKADYALGSISDNNYANQDMTCSDNTIANDIYAKNSCNARDTLFYNTDTSSFVASDKERSKEVSSEKNQGFDKTYYTDSLSASSSEKTQLELVDMKYIGQAFSTYIILQNGDELVLVDQHAAHERIIYEKLKTKFETQENTTQLLLEPVVIQLQAFELDTIKTNIDLFNKIGFVFEDFGNNSIIIRGIPYLMEGYSPKEIFLELADKIQESVKPVSTPVADDIIHTIACKAAIKANKKLDNKEVHQLLTELAKTGRRYTCPHGRPTVVRLTKYEIEKMFKRII